MHSRVKRFRGTRVRSTDGRKRTRSGLQSGERRGTRFPRNYLQNLRKQDKRIFRVDNNSKTACILYQCVNELKHMMRTSYVRDNFVSTPTSTPTSTPYQLPHQTHIKPTSAPHQLHINSHIRSHMRSHIGQTSEHMRSHMRSYMRSYMSSAVTKQDQQQGLERSLVRLFTTAVLEKRKCSEWNACASEVGEQDMSQFKRV